MKGKNILLIALPLILLTGVAVTTIFSLNNMHSAAVQQYLPFQEGLAQLNERVLQIDRLQTLAVGDPAYNDSIASLIVDATALSNKMAHGGSEVYGSFALLKDGSLRQRIQDINKQLDEYSALHTAKSNDAHLMPNRTREALSDAMIYSAGVGLSDSVANALLDLEPRLQANIDYSNEEFQALAAAGASLAGNISQLRNAVDTARNQETGGITLWMMVLSGLLVLVAVSSGFLMIRRSIQLARKHKAMKGQIKSDNGLLNANAEFAEKIGRGELDVEFQPKDESDVLGHSLVNMRNNLKQVAEDDAKRNWATGGLAKFAEILRSNSENLEELAYDIISNMVRYLEANQGGLFILDSENPDETEIENMHLDLLACYAYERKKYQERRIMVGQGLVGQSVLEREKIYMTQIPDNYVTITSGLGESTPRSILIMPLMVNDQIYGVVEIASFNLFEDHQIEFVEKLGESIASTISGVKINVRTASLLEESQKMTEEMRAQEEEMRQNMEELQATQDEMARKEAEITGQLKAIDRTMAMVEFDINGMVQNANAFFIETMGYTNFEEIRGIHHRSFVPDDMVNSTAYQEFWDRLRNGENFRGDYRRMKKSGEEIWLNASYTVMFDMNGVPQKVLKFASDITDQKKLSIDFESQLNAINKVNATIELDLKGSILNANDIFLEVTGYSMSELRNKHHRTLVDGDTAASDHYAKQWKELTEGRFQSGTFKLNSKEGKSVWLQGSLNPVFNLEGKPYKIVMIATDYTAAQEQEELMNRQMQEMIAQEQQMIENMEALQATQEEMARKQKEFEQVKSSSKSHQKALEDLKKSSAEKEQALQERIRELESQLNGKS